MNRWQLTYCVFPVGSYSKIDDHKHGRNHLYYTGPEGDEIEIGPDDYVLKEEFAKRRNLAVAQARKIIQANRDNMPWESVDCEAEIYVNGRWVTDNDWEHFRISYYSKNNRYETEPLGWQ